jgi:hypothetical protein
MSISVSVFLACICVLVLAGEYYTAQNKVDIYDNERQGWEACRLTEPNYFEANAEAVSNCLNNLEKAKENFWVSHPKNQIILLFVLAGLGSAISGYLGVWCVWFVGVGVHRLVRWVKVCLERRDIHIGRDPIREALERQKEKDIVQEVEEIENNIRKPGNGGDSGGREDFVEQVEFLRDEVCSVRSDIEKLSEMQDKKYTPPKDEFVD